MPSAAYFRRSTAKVMQTRAETNRKVRLCRVQLIFAVLRQRYEKNATPAYMAHYIFILSCLFRFRRNPPGRVRVAMEAFSRLRSPFAAVKHGTREVWRQGCKAGMKNNPGRSPVIVVYGLFPVRNICPYYKKIRKKRLVFEKSVSLHRFFERELVLIGEIGPERLMTVLEKKSNKSICTTE